MQRVANYDSKALEILYNKYSPILYTLIKKILSDDKIASEVLADVFVIVWLKAHRFNFKTGNVYSWLVLLTRNKAVDTLRRNRFKAGMPEYTDRYEDKYILPELSPEIDVLDLETALNLKENMESALKKLTDAQQYVLYLAFYEGFTQNEIATKLNIPIATVKLKVKNALKNLHDNLVGESA